MKRATILGTGSCLPERIMTNIDLEKMVDTSDEWITSRTGIRSRHIAGPGEETSKMAAEACRRAMLMAGLTPKDINLIIVATISPEMTMPSCACLVQKEIGAVNAFAFDINAACSGFVYGLDMAEKYLRADPAMKILVIGAENLSSRTNWRDRNTCVLFGDGAGACVVGASFSSERGIVGSRLYSDGSLWELLSMNGAPSMNPFLGLAPGEDAEFSFSELGNQRQSDGAYISMVGRDVFKHAVLAMENAVLSVLEQENLAVDQIKLVIPHQANIRILNNLTERLGLEEKIYINVSKYGNTSAASVPIALDEANREGRLQENDLLLFCVFGGGFTWGAMAMRW